MEDPLICGINRDRDRVTAFSFSSVEEALKWNRDNSGRMISLNGDWDFYFAIKPENAPAKFFKTKHSDWEFFCTEGRKSVKWTTIP